MKRLVFVARRARLVVAIAALATGLNVVAQAQVVQPLRTVDIDSVMLYDFFWCGVQREVDEAVGGSVRAWPWQTNSETADGLEQRTAAWEQRLQKLDLWGLDSDDSNNIDGLKQLLRESTELGLLNRQARFFELAERLLANPVMRYWHNSDKAQADRELAAALRAMGSMAYTVSGRDVYINMLVRCNVHLQSDSIDLFAQVVNSSPWYNDMSLRIVKDMSMMEQTVDTVLSAYQRLIFHEQYDGDSVDAVFHIRIPSWTGSGEMLPRYTASARRQRVQIFVNGTPVRAEMKDGYAVISKRWTVGDQIVIKMPTPILRIYDKQDNSRVALQRGPLLYVADNKADGWSLDPESAVSHEFSQPLQAIVLKGELQNEYGKKPFEAAPAYMTGEKNEIFMPVK